MIEGRDIVNHTMYVARRDALNILENERKDLAEFAMSVASMRLFDAERIDRDPAGLVLELEEMIAAYALKRSGALLSKKAEFDESDAILQSAVHQIEGTLQ